MGSLPQRGALGSRKAGSSSGLGRWSLGRIVCPAKGGQMTMFELDLDGGVGCRKRAQQHKAMGTAAE